MIHILMIIIALAMMIINAVSHSFTISLQACEIVIILIMIVNRFNIYLCSCIMECGAAMILIFLIIHIMIIVIGVSTFVVVLWKVGSFRSFIS